MSDDIITRRNKDVHPLTNGGLKTEVKKLGIFLPDLCWVCLLECKLLGAYMSIKEELPDVIKKQGECEVSLL